MGILVPIWLIGGFRALKQLFSRKKNFTGSQIGANVRVGHLLHQPYQSDNTAETETCDYVIVGGGVTGLSAARRLHQHQQTSVRILDLDAQAGGNAISGVNGVSVYPWGAHYLPIPNLENKELLDFLASHQVITGYNAAGLPIYNDYYLCHEPTERLYLHGKWQEGLIPSFGITKADEEQISRFLNLMQTYRQAIGTDGKRAFAIPVDESSADEVYRKLDQISFAEFLHQQQLTSPYVIWYANYCCKDDFGIDHVHTSAWAGIHYFASRNGKASNAERNAVLTWPEGNAWLVQKLNTEIPPNTVTCNALVRQITQGKDGVIVEYTDTKTMRTHRIQAKKCLVCTPQFVNRKIIRDTTYAARKSDTFTYAPWLVANVTLNQLPTAKDVPLCWDNVIYNSDSLGYVWTGSQQLQAMPQKAVLTYYHPLSTDGSMASRMKALHMTYQQQTDLVLKNLTAAHPDIEKSIDSIDTWVWGHGMIAPIQGFIWGSQRREAGESIHKKLFFAHTDLSGISIFEEAFYQGIKAATQALSDA